MQVLIDDSAKDYGIFAENMLKTAQSVAEENLKEDSEDIDLWQVATGCENAWGGWGDPGGGNKELHWVQMKDRTEGTERETCIDVFSVNENLCHKFNVGLGEDAKMPYKREK